VALSGDSNRACAAYCRPELAKVIRRLEKDDVLVVVRLDRLAQSARDLLNVLDEIGKRGDGFRSLKDTWADTTTPHGKLMVTVLGGLAEFERTLIAARTGEGRKRAKERGLLFGRPHKMTPHQRQEALQRLAAWRLWRLKSARGCVCQVVSEGPEATAGFVGADNRPSVRERRDIAIKMHRSPNQLKPFDETERGFSIVREAIGKWAARCNLNRNPEMPAGRTADN
jgi:Resolvase, N terminal domain